MADSNVDITAGSGISIDTRTEASNGNHRQVVCLGDPSTNAGVCPIDATNGVAVDVKVLPASTNTIEVVGDAAENAAAAGNPLLSGGRYDSSPRTLGDGDVGAIALDADGAIHISDGGNSITIDNSDITTIAGAVSGSEMQVDIVASLPAGTNAIGKLSANSGVDIGDVDILSVPAPLNVVGSGTEAAALRVTMASDSTGVLSIDDNGGSITIDGTVTANLSATDNAVLDNIDTNVSTIAGAVSGTEMQVDVITIPGLSGDVAHDSADSGNPLKIGGKAKNHDGTAPGTAVAEDDRVDFIADVYGRQFVESSHPNNWSIVDDQSSAQTNTVLVAAPGAGLSLYITDIIVSNDSTAGTIKLVENTGTPVSVTGVVYMAGNGGFVTNLKTPIKLTANTNLGYTSVTVVNHSVTVTGYIAP
jgi:hypothetical protein